MNVLGLISVLVSVLPGTTYAHKTMNVAKTPPSFAAAWILSKVDIPSNASIIEFLNLDPDLTVRTIYTNCDGFSDDDSIGTNFEARNQSYAFTTGHVDYWYVMFNPDDLEGSPSINIEIQARAKGNTFLPSMTADSYGTVKSAHSEGACSGIGGIYDNTTGILTGSINREYKTVIINGEEVELPAYNISVNGDANLYDEG